MNRQKRGFTIIEFIVTISILLIITTAILLKYPNFRQNIFLKRTAQEIALTLRQAQTYGLSTKESQPGTNVFSGYGVHFESGSDSFVLFSDTNDNKTYDGSGEDVQKFKIQTGDKIADLCVNTTCGIGKMDIVFYRKTTPPVNITADSVPQAFGSDAGVVIISLHGQTKTIRVLASGQISVP